MLYDIKELLKLPDEEKIAIADLLYSSLDDEFEENNNPVPWYEDEGFLKELDRRTKEWEEGKVKGYSFEEVKNLMKEHKANYKRK
jgi:putative addiction module component (TIGR02574 family)